jgi:D-alanyl-D-alanine carboxypeptidase
MTCLVSLKLVRRFKLNPQNLYFSVSATAAETKGTTANLEEGEWVLVEDLLYALMLPSGNDAAMVLAENFGCLLYFNSIGQS